MEEQEIMGFMVLTEFYTRAPVILRSDRIIEVAETNIRGTCNYHGIRKQTVGVCDGTGCECVLEVAEDEDKGG